MCLEQTRKGGLLEAMANDVNKQLNGNFYMQISHCLPKNHYASLEVQKSLDLRRICFSVYRKSGINNNCIQVRRFWILLIFLS